MNIKMYKAVSGNFLEIDSTNQITMKEIRERFLDDVYWPY